MHIITLHYITFSRCKVTYSIFLLTCTLVLLLDLLAPVCPDWFHLCLVINGNFSGWRATLFDPGTRICICQGRADGLSTCARIVPVILDWCERMLESMHLNNISDSKISFFLNRRDVKCARLNKLNTHSYFKKCHFIFHTQISVAKYYLTKQVCTFTSVDSINFKWKLY